MTALTRHLEVPDNLMETEAVRTGEEFDVNEYFTVLTHLSPEAGYVLDYVYEYDFMGGYPIIYARPEEEIPYATVSEYHEAEGSVLSGAYLENIRVDGTAGGFFELVIFAIYGEKFYLWWHANYNDLTVVCSRGAIEAAIAEDDVLGNPLTIPQWKKVLGVDFKPWVEFESTTVRVRVVTFTKWGGLFEEIYTISRDFPHKILGRERKELVPYDCGIVF